MATKIHSEPKTDQSHQSHSSIRSKYGNFFLMVVACTVVMFATSYIGSASFEHIFFSQTLAYMTLAMGAVMTIVMWLFMRDMLNDRHANIIVVLASIVVFALSTWLLRSHKTIGDVAFMEAMIPHHSMAILSGEGAQLSDPRVKNLAARIVRSQTSEIAEMKALIQDIKSVP